MRRPTAQIAIALALGIALASRVSVSSTLYPYLFPALILVLLLGLTCWFRFGERTGFWLLPCLAFFLLGIISCHLHAHPPSPYHLANISTWSSPRPTLVEGRVCLPPERISQGQGEEGIRVVLDRVVLEAASKVFPARGRIRLHLPPQPEELRYGERIRLRAQLRPPRGYLNPGGFHLPDHLLSQGIYLEGTATDEEEIIRLGRWEGRTPLALIYDLRARMLQRLGTLVTSPHLGVLEAITLGERSSLDRKTREDFVASGTYHILAISGLHVGMVAGFLFFFLRLVRIPRRLCASLSIAMIIFYAFLAGGSSSVVRASIMTVLFLGGIVLEREADLYNTLALAALLILLSNPFHLLEPGFQLTFAATLGIIMITKDLNPRLSRGWWKWLAGSLLVSLAATLATFPLLARHFHRASLVGVLANLPVVPLTGLLTGLGLLLALLSLFPLPGLHLIGRAIDFLLVLLTSLAHFFSTLPGSSLWIYEPSIPMIVLYYGALLLIGQWRRHRWAQIGCGICLFLLALLVGYRLHQVHHGTQLRVTFLDVGQGDCALLELPGGRAILVDGGGNRRGEFDVGEQVVKPYLLHRWVGKLDLIVLSHPHPDHLGGIISLVRGFPVKELWEARIPQAPPLQQELHRLLQEKGIVLHRWLAGEVPDPIGPLRIEILHPSPPLFYRCHRGSFAAENNNSLVLRIHFGQMRFLFCGDIEEEAERRIMARRPELTCQVLKVPHHGGKTSSSLSFIRAVSPRYAVFSAGAHNPFGHPSAEVMYRYQQMGVRLLSTARHGAVMMLTDGERLRVWAAGEESGWMAKGG